ncbi:MAG: Gfo/Idh/MocA family oxidoreductase [Planctomycetia bacterium]|nr:Gfo/Idh/MocA family oxidoreductase [Planctomycetia bacterium]
MMPNRKKQGLSRRAFCQQGIGWSAAVAFPLVLPTHVLGREGQTAPSETLTMGAVGIGGRGRHVLNTFMKRPDVRVLGVCDVQQSRRLESKACVDQKYGDTACAMYNDMRELFARQDIDFVMIATGNRWHTLASIWAARQGKDIYCEKPVSMTFQEARAVQAAIHHYDVVFQAGTQRRNSDNFQFAVSLAQSGKLGKLTEVHANILWPGTRPEWRPGEPQPPVEVCDWDRWLGPVQWRPYHSAYLRIAGWYRYDDFEGEMPGWASHTLDMCQWAAQKDTEVPVEWFPQFDEKGNQKWDIHARYADGLKLIMRPADWLGLGTCGIRLVGEEGWVETADSRRVEVSHDRLRQGMRVFRVGISEVPHVAEFLDCVRTRRTCTSNIDVTVNSHIACHCSSIAWKLGRHLTFDPTAEKFHDRAADGLLSRAMREPYTLT